jgi:DNA primase
MADSREGTDARTPPNATFVPTTGAMRCRLSFPLGRVTAVRNLPVAIVSIHAVAGVRNEPLFRGRRPHRCTAGSRLQGWLLADDRVKQVKEANDIVEVVGEYLSLRKAGPTYKGLCPFHDDHHPSFDVDPRRQRYRCWSCGKYGDVISFVQEHDHVGFVEALELLARRANIELDPSGAATDFQGRARLLDVVRWAAQQFHECLLDDPQAEEARRYLGERGLTGETVRKYGLGYAPRSGNWLSQKAETGGVAPELLEKAGLIAPREQGPGYYDRFRDRIQFPIRNPQGQTIGFGGRILPSSPLAARAPKYYNSSDTLLFIKSENLYGIDQARHAAASAGYLAVVEGYTDVLMAHQMGVVAVVATMGTALNTRHVRQLRRFAPRVVLVFDADAGGDTGVDRALALFVSQDVDLAVATLPAGLDPCDLLLAQGPDAFRAVLDGAVDALEFKLTHVLAGEGSLGVEGRRRAVESVLSVIAQAPALPGHAGAVKMQLLINRIAHRLALKEETVWARLDELRKQRGGATDPRSRREPVADDAERKAPAAPEERQLLEVLLAEPDLVSVAAQSVRPEEIVHPGLRLLLAGLYGLLAAGEPAELDQLRGQLDNPRLAERAMKLQEVGRGNSDRTGCLRMLLNLFEERRRRPALQELQNRLQAPGDHEAALELLRQLTTRNVVGAG